MLNALTIDTRQLPEHVRFDLLSAAYDVAAAYFQQPGAEAFKRRKTGKAGRAAETATRKAAAKKPCRSRGEPWA